jgi:hypothetical protein
MSENRGVEKGSTMGRPHLLIAVAWLLNGAAWFLPVVTHVFGGRIGPPIIGVDAFVMAASAVWPRQFFGTAYEAVLTTLTVLTALFFIVGSPWAVFRGTPSLRRVAAWVATAAFFFNAHWYIRLSPDGWISGLGIGYFLWWLSFAVLGVGLFDLAGQSSPAESVQRQAALLPR